jgi:hypothetical protein
MSVDGTMLFMAAATLQSGGGPSFGRFYNIALHGPSDRRATLAHSVPLGGHLQASCLSPNGRFLLISTVYQSFRLLVFTIGRFGDVELTANSSMPELDTSANYTYGASCRVNDDGDAVMTFPLFFSITTVNQTAVAGYSLGHLPSSRLAGPKNLLPSWLWFSEPVSSLLQDIPAEDVMSSDGSLYAFASWGGTAALSSSQVPPTLRVFRTTSSTSRNDPLFELRTPSSYPYVTPSGNLSMSASLVSLDMQSVTAGNASTLHVIAVGSDAHTNTGSSGGIRYLWRLTH